jgi:hypothetical protein
MYYIFCVNISDEARPGGKSFVDFQYQIHQTFKVFLSCHLKEFPTHIEHLHQCLSFRSTALTHRD